MKVSAKRLYHQFAHATGFDELRAYKGETAQKSATHKKSFNRIKRLFTKRVRRALQINLKDCEQKPFEPKFNKGDWIIRNNEYTGIPVQVLAFDGCYSCVLDGEVVTLMRADVKGEDPRES